MLVLTRKLGESLRIGDDIKITVLNIDKNQFAILLIPSFKQEY